MIATNRHQEADGNDDAEQGEQRPELGRPDGAEGEAECFQERHA